MFCLVLLSSYLYDIKDVFTLTYSLIHILSFIYSTLVRELKGLLDRILKVYTQNKVCVLKREIPHSHLFKRYIFSA